MQKRSVTFDLFIYDSPEELPADDQLLLQAAIRARENAYAPYSNFKVGAAVKMQNGEIVIGNNQENASYPSGLCAERVAIFQAGALYPGIPVTAIAISAASEKYKVNRPAAPCGNCRQAIAEYEQKQNNPVKLLMTGEIGQVYVCRSLSDILPLGFNNSYLS